MSNVGARTPSSMGIGLVNWVKATVGDDNVFVAVANTKDSTVAMPAPTLANKLAVMRAGVVLVIGWIELLVILCHVSPLTTNYSTLLVICQ